MCIRKKPIDCWHRLCYQQTGPLSCDMAAAEDLETAELDVRDPDYEMLIGVRVQKTG